MIKWKIAELVLSEEKFIIQFSIKHREILISFAITRHVFADLSM